jgi:uncharacterized membrane protein
MKHLHLIWGIILFIVFAVTGRFMRVDFPDKEIIPPELRILMRSRHIYILFSALIHLALGVYLQISLKTWRKASQIFGSVLLIVASGLLIWGFVSETYYFRTFSDLSRFGIYLSLAGIGFHLIGGFQRQNLARQ